METSYCDECHHLGYTFIAEMGTSPLPFCWLCGADIWKETESGDDETDSGAMNEGTEAVVESESVTESNRQVKPSVETLDGSEDHDPFITMFFQAEMKLELASYSFSAVPVSILVGLKAPQTDA